MPKFRKKPVLVEATQWFKNGDHPLDHADQRTGLFVGNVNTLTPALPKLQQWEGKLVRYYRNPIMDENGICKHCKNPMHVHGWIDTLEGGHIICPSDWIITGIKGEHYPCKPDIFSATYEPV